MRTERGRAAVFLLSVSAVLGSAGCLTAQKVMTDVNARYAQRASVPRTIETRHTSTIKQGNSPELTIWGKSFTQQKAGKARTDSEQGGRMDKPDSKTSWVFDGASLTMFTEAPNVPPKATRVMTAALPPGYRNPLDHEFPDVMQRASFSVTETDLRGTPTYLLQSNGLVALSATSSMRLRVWVHRSEFLILRIEAEGTQMMDGSPDPIQVRTAMDMNTTFGAVIDDSVFVLKVPPGVTVEDVSADVAARAARFAP